MTKRIAVSILSESRLLREALAIRLSCDPQARFVAAAGNVHGLRAQLQRRSTEILLVYADIESFAGGVVWDIKSLLPAARVIALGFREARTGADGSALWEDHDEAQRWIKAGALAYLPCAASYASLRKTICDVAAGCPPCPRDVSLQVVRRSRTLAEVD